MLHSIEDRNHLIRFIGFIPTSESLVHTSDTAHGDELWNFYDQKTNYSYFIGTEIIFISSCSSFLN
jgi:hypothetical protein